MRLAAKHKADIIAVGMLLAISAIFLYEGFLPGRALYGSDVLLQFHAWRDDASRGSGSFPFWLPSAWQPSSCCHFLNSYRT